MYVVSNQSLDLSESDWAIGRPDFINEKISDFDNCTNLEQSGSIITKQ